MNDAAVEVGHRDLGVSRSDLGVKATLCDDGTVAIEATPFDGGKTDRVILEKDQALGLVAWLVNREEIANSG